MFKWFSLLAMLAAMVAGWWVAQSWHPGGIELATTRTNESVSGDTASSNRLATGERLLDVLRQSEDPSLQLGPQAQTPTVFADGVADPLERALAESRYDDAIALIRNDFPAYVKQRGALQRLSTALVDLNRMTEALELLYELRLYASLDEEAPLLNLIQDIVTLSENRLAVKPVQPNILVDLYQALVIWHPDYTPYTLKLATWQMLAGDTAAAEQSLLGTVNDPRFADQVTALREQIEFVKDEQLNPSVRVPLQQKGNHFVASVSLDDSVVAELMLDTGASMSIIKDELMATLSPITAPETLLINTANGAVQGQRQRLARLQLGELNLENVDVGSLPLENLAVDGLLGMDVLGRFEFFIDQEQSELRLRPRPNLP